MSKNLINDKQTIFDRIDKLTPNSQRLWGKMNVNQMLRHLNEAMKLPLSEITVKSKNGTVKQKFMKIMILAGVPAPKGKAKTFPEIDIVEKGIDPKDFTEEVKSLKDIVNRFVDKENTADLNPMLGKMSKDDWARLDYVHMHHHLKQFGV